MYELGFRNTRSGLFFFFLPASLPLLHPLLSFLAVFFPSLPRAAALTQPAVDAPTSAWQLIRLSLSCPISRSVKHGESEEAGLRPGLKPSADLSLAVRNPGDSWLSSVAHTPAVSLGLISVYQLLLWWYLISQSEPTETLMKSKRDDDVKVRIYYCTT